MVNMNKMNKAVKSIRLKQNLSEIPGEVNSHFRLYYGNIWVDDERTGEF